MYQNFRAPSHCGEGRDPAGARRSPALPSGRCHQESLSASGRVAEPHACRPAGGAAGAERRPVPAPAPRVPHPITPARRFFLLFFGGVLDGSPHSPCDAEPRGCPFRPGLSLPLHPPPLPRTDPPVRRSPPGAGGFRRCGPGPALPPPAPLRK